MCLPTKSTTRETYFAVCDTGFPRKNPIIREKQFAIGEVVDVAVGEVVDVAVDEGDGTFPSA
jgi:hypothetical protein